MKIFFEKPRHEQLIHNPQKLERKYKGHSRNIIKQIQNLQSAPNPKELPPSCNCHALKGKMKGFFAIDLDPSGKRGKERIIFRPLNDYQTDIQKIEIISICELCTDYH